MRGAALPYIDEHTRVIEAGVEEVWRGLLHTLERSFSRPGAARYARLVGAADGAASGPRPLAEGSAFPGFRVVRALPGRELALEGRHRFSAYALTFRLDGLGPRRTLLRAESRGTFPDVAGALYRTLVLRTGGHAHTMRRLLAGIRPRTA